MTTTDKIIADLMKLRDEINDTMQKLRVNAAALDCSERPEVMANGVTIYIHTEAPRPLARGIGGQWERRDSGTFIYWQQRLGPRITLNIWDAEPKIEAGNIVNLEP